MKNITILLSNLLLAFTTLLYAQEADSPRIKYHHTIRAGISLAPGFMPKHNTGNVYVVGDLEYYLSDHVSIVGSVMYFLNTTTDKAIEDEIMALNRQGTVLKLNHQLYSGFHYHFLKDKGFDPYIGFQPGFAVSQTNDNYYDEDFTFVYPAPRHDTKIAFNPMLSLDAGFNFYAVKYFHLFVNGKYAMGRHLGGLKPYSLNEFSVMFGLGFNANFWNKKGK